VAALALGAVLIPSHTGTGLRSGVDVWGALLITAAPALAVYAILEAASNGWLSARTLGMAGVTAVLFAAFILVESRARHPLVPLRFFRSRNVAGAVLVRALFPVGMFGAFFLGALYLQRVLGYSPVGAGLAFMPMNLCVALFSLFVTARLVGRFGAKATLMPGLVLMTVGLLLLGRAPVNAAYVIDVLPALLLMGTGAGLIFMPSVLLAMSGVDGTDSGLASGVANVAIQMGAAVGVAVLASVSAADTSGLLSRGVVLDGALTSGYHLGFTVAAGCVAMAALAGAVVLRGARPAVVPETEEEFGQVGVELAA